jgi:Na+/H+ antiporter NhaD/arsenite permease-like protein
MEIEMLTIGLVILLATLVWEFSRLLQAENRGHHQFSKRKPVASPFSLLVYGTGVVLLVIGSIALQHSGHAGLGVSSFAASGVCLFSLLQRDAQPPDDRLAS